MIDDDFVIDVAGVLLLALFCVVVVVAAVYCRLPRCVVRSSPR